MTTMSNEWLPIVATLVLARVAALAQVVETSNGKVEFIGLEKWTPATIQEKLGYASPDKFHFCAADLKERLKFADASVTVDRENGKRYTIIAVVEPDHAQRIRYKPLPTGSIPVPDEWRGLIGFIQEGRVLNGLLDYGSTLTNAIRPKEPLMSGEDTTWWRLLQPRQSQHDYESALKTLEEDHDYRHRAVAAMILTNFAHRDAAWVALMEGVRDESAVVNTVCMQALITLAHYVPRRVDWSSAAFSVRYVLNGTNLFALPHVIETLLKTEVESKLAGPLLKDNGGRMLLAYLRAKHEKERVLVHRLLVQLRGSDLGFDESRWDTWIASLK